MRTSRAIVEMLGEITTRHSSFREVHLCWDGMIRFRTRNMDDLLGKMHEMSLSHSIGYIESYSYEPPHVPWLTIYLQPSTDGQTNIDVEFMERLSKLTIIPDGGKWEA